MFRLSKLDAQAQHGFTPYPNPANGHASVTAKGYTGAASRPGYGSYFGGQERAWQSYEFQRKHQSGPGNDPGASYVLLADKNGVPQPGLSCEIGGRLCVSSEIGFNAEQRDKKYGIRLLDESYYSKCAETLKEQRDHVQKITGMALQSAELCKAMFPGIEAYFAGYAMTGDQTIAYVARLTDQTTNTGVTVYNALANLGVPTDLVKVGCHPDHLNSLSPYSSTYADGVAKLMCLIRNQNVAFTSEISGENPMNKATTEDKHKLVVQQKGVDVK